MKSIVENKIADEIHETTEDQDYDAFDGSGEFPGDEEIAAGRRGYFI